MFGDLVVVFKNKQGDRLIDDAIAIGIKGYMRHHPNCKREDLVAYISPKLNDELKSELDGHEIPMDVSDVVPYPDVWVCLKESVDV